MQLGQGVATLVAGTLTVNLPKIRDGCRVVLTPVSLLGTPGTLRVIVDAGSGFTITSLSALDVSQVQWVVFY